MDSFYIIFFLSNHIHSQPIILLHNADSIIESKVIYYLEQCRLRI